MIKHLEDLLYRIQDDPVTYALRVVCLLGVGLFVIFARNLYAAPILQAEGEGHVITLTDEPCALEAIANMPMRATWKEPNGKVWEACYGAMGGAVVFYCADKTIQVLPMQGFRPVVGI